MSTSPTGEPISRQRTSQMSPPPSSAAAPNGSTAAAKPAPPLLPRTSPYLPTPSERLLLALYPSLLVFGTLFAVLSPEVRAAPYDASRHAHVQDHRAPSYFARKDNVLNVLFVKRGWFWVTAAFALFVVTHPAAQTATQKARAVVRWALVTAWWVVVTQWCFGPPIIDRGFTWTGGKCRAVETEVAMERLEGEDVRVLDAVTAAACRSSGGRWSGGHDISGHVFLLVLGSAFLVQEAGWAVLKRAGKVREERRVVMGDGAVKGAGVEEERVDLKGGEGEQEDVLGLGGKVVAGVVVLSWWMMLMTAIYFHTWFEKLTGLLVALAGLYAVYILPRWIHPLRNVIGMPGI